MYNAKQIKPFLEKVNKEAEEAAQKVYDKYQDEFIQRVKNQIDEGTVLHFAMGSGYVVKDGVDKDELSDTIFMLELSQQLQYNKLRASFDINKVEK